MAQADHHRFEAALSTAAAECEALLARLLPAGAGNRLHAAMRYAALGQGKRLRPFLVTETAALFGLAGLSPARVGAALECVHCYSLVHDDLPAMDDDALRRGQPTTHRKFDEATAILAGDALLTLAFDVLSDPETHADPAVRVTLVAELAKAAGEAGMVGGQMLDIHAETAGFSSLQEIAGMQAMKTGALFRFACEAGAILAGQERQPLRQYADHIGLAFQIVDDILDVEASPEVLGKATGKDKSRHKATFVDFLGLEGARQETRRLTDAAGDALAHYGTRADRLREVAHFIVARKK